MTIALSTDPLEKASDRTTTWVDRLLAGLAVACIVGLLIYGAVRLF